MDKCRRLKKTWNYKENIGQAKQGTKEQKGKISHGCSLNIRRATNRRRTKTETLRFEWAETKIQMQINGELESKQREPTSWSSRATKTHSSWFFGLDYAWGLKI